MGKDDIVVGLRNKDYCMMERVLAAECDPDAWTTKKEPGIGDNDADSYTLLQIAVLMKDARAVRLLIEAGAEVHRTLYRRNLPIMLACKRDENSDHGCVKALLAAGANPNVFMHGYSCSPLYAVITNRDCKLVEMLLDHGATTETTISDRKVILSGLYDDNDVDIGRLLIKKGAAPFIEVAGRDSEFRPACGASGPSGLRCRG